ncbi:MAG: RNA polymerase sigma factor [Gammaproteobacteria bacterium]|nr:RNA polymerase sigma factor [Gammaproteobacteria bacterium]
MENYQQCFIDTIPYLRRYARAYTGDTGSGDALVYQTLECAYNLINFLQTDTDVAIWLFSILHNINVEDRRAEEESAEATVLDIEPWDLSLLDDMEFDEIDIVSALARLPADQKEAFLLVSLERFSYEESSEILNIPMGTLILRLNSARKFLIKYLLSDDFSELRAAQ